MACLQNNLLTMWYLDAKYSRWLSADPAVGEYMSGTYRSDRNESR